MPQTKKKKKKKADYLANIQTVEALQPAAIISYLEIESPIHAAKVKLFEWQPRTILYYTIKIINIINACAWYPKLHRTIGQLLRDISKMHAILF